MVTRARIWVAVVLVACLAGLLVLALPGCGGDPWSGTWKSTQRYLVNGASEPTRTTFTIAAAGDGWTVTDGIGNATSCKELDGRLVGAEKSSEWFELRDDRLVLVDAGGTVLGEFTKE